MITLNYKFLKYKLIVMEDEDSLGSEFWEGVEDIEACPLGDFDEAGREISPYENFDQPAASTSRGRGRGRGRNPTGNLSIQCHKCSGKLKTMEGYISHLMMHLAQDLYKLAPGYNAVRAYCRTVSKTILSSYSSSPILRSEYSAPIVAVANQLLLANEEMCIFLDFIIDSLWECVPDPVHSKLTDFRSRFEKSVKDKVLQNAEHRVLGMNVLRDTLTINAEDRVVKFFLGDFSMKMSSEIEVFYLKYIREPHAALLFGGRKCVEAARDDPEDHNFQSSIYYIAGSTVRSVVRKGMKATNNPTWNKVITCICDRMIVGEEGIAPDKQVTFWTKSRDRGGLLRVTQLLWIFFMALSGVLKKVEDSDGSVVYSKVLDCIHCDNSICLLWSDVISDKLTKEESDSLLKEICVSFAGTWGKGVALRRKNAVKGLSKDKVPLRPSLVPH